MSILLLCLGLVSPTLADDPTPAEVVTLPAGMWRYVGPFGSVTGTAAELAQRILAAPQARHVVWRPELGTWTLWSNVPDLVTAVATAGAERKLSYTAGGPVEQLTAIQIAERVRAAPTSRHLAWHPGMVAWLSADRIPEIAHALGAEPADPPPADASAGPWSTTSTETPPPLPPARALPPPPPPEGATPPPPPVPR